MKLGKHDTNIIHRASSKKLDALERAIDKEKARRENTYHKDTGAKMGTVLYNLYVNMLITKIKIVKDDRNVLYRKFKKETGMWSGNKYVFRNKLRLDPHDGWQSFFIDYANKKHIKKIKTKVKIQQWYGQGT